MKNLLYLTGEIIEIKQHNIGHEHHWNLKEINHRLPNAKILKIQYLYLGKVSRASLRLCCYVFMLFMLAFVNHFEGPEPNTTRADVQTRTVG